MPDRRVAARDRRIAAAESAFIRPVQGHLNNAEESDYPFIANYSKGMPHNDDGVMRADGYLALLRALSTQRWEDFEAIPLGGKRKPRRLTNPQAGLAFDLEGPDAHAIALPPAPRIDSAENSAEMVELYWMASARDVPFSDYATDPVVERAADELSSMSDFRGPKEDRRVTPNVLFRGTSQGDLRGPYVSQFLYHDVPFGTLLIQQRQDTVEPNLDYVTDWKTWLDVQNGEEQPEPKRNYAERRYLQTARDLAHYVHYDALYQAYLNAAMILLKMNAILDFGNPYEYSQNQVGFGTYGPPHIQTLVTEVATRALKAVWYTKWFVHRRMRPEEFGGRIHAHKTGLRDVPMIHQEVLDSGALKVTFDRYKSYLLPQAFPEGSPIHPSYGAGHATVAGACVTVLKAWFCESFVLPNPVVPDRSGTRLVPYDGPEPLFAGGELNKLATNIATARNMAGVHWRTDGSESLELGEAIAIDLLREHKEMTSEDTTFTLSRFDGTTIFI